MPRPKSKSGKAAEKEASMRNETLQDVVVRSLEDLKAVDLKVLECVHSTRGPMNVHVHGSVVGADAKENAFVADREVAPSGNNWTRPLLVARANDETSAERWDTRESRKFESDVVILPACIVAQ